MTKTSILLETEFMPGDIVSPKVDKEVKYMVNTYCILKIDETGRVVDYTIGASNSDGVEHYFRTNELQYSTIN